MKLTRVFLAFLLALAVLAGAVAMLVNGDHARAAPAQSYCAGCRSEFGYGVATHGSGTITRFGNTDINNSGEDALDLGTLSSSAETWVVGELNDHADIQYLMSSWVFYDSQAIDRNQTGKAPWRYVLSTEKGEPSPGTFIVTHVALQAIVTATGDVVTDTRCGAGGYCIFGLNDNSAQYWSQDGDLDDGFNSFSSDLQAVLTEWGFDDHFGNHRKGEIEITTTNFITMYPWLGTNQTVHDIRPVGESYISGTHRVGIEFIVGGVIYNPKDDTYTNGQFREFVEDNSNMVYVIFNLPNCLRWLDCDPILPESYDSLYYEYEHNVSTWNNTASTMVTLAPEDWTYNEDWPQDMVDDATGTGGKYENDTVPLEAWGIMAYMAGAASCSEASEILGSTKDTITTTVNMISDVNSSDVDSMDRWVMEVSIMGGTDRITDREKWLVHSLGDWMYDNKDEWVLKKFFFQPTFLQPTNQPFWNIGMPFICAASSCYATDLSDGWKDAAAATSPGACP